MFEGKEVQDKVKKNVDKVLSMEMEEMTASPARETTVEHVTGSKGEVGYKA